MAPRPPSARYEPEQAMHMRDWLAIKSGIDALQDGRVNVRGVITLCASSATTTLTNRLIGEHSFVALTPRTASAQADTLSAAFYVVPGHHEASIKHSITGSHPRIFHWAILG